MAQGAWDTGTWDAALWDSLPVTGVVGTGSAGNEGVTVTVALSGAAATAAVGNVSLVATAALVGVDATGSVGTVTYYVPPIIIIDDTHDGDYKKKRWADEREKKEKRKREIIDLYERIVEGKPEIAEEIVAPFVKTKARGQQTAPTARQIDFDKLMRDISRVEALLTEHIEMDDEEVLALL